MPRSPVTTVIQSFNGLTEDEKKLCLDFIAPEPEPEPPVKQTRKKRTTKSAKAQSLSTAITSSREAKAEADSNGEAESTDETPGVKCGVCGNPEDFQDHFKPSPHYHPFASPVASATGRSSRKGAAANNTPSTETNSEGALAVGASGD